jgi:hypothetical protein
LSNMSAKNAFTSPPRNHGFCLLVVKVGRGKATTRDERIRA